MAINVNPGQPLRHVSTYTSSGNFVTPQGKTLAFVSMHSATGGGSGGAGTRYGGTNGNGAVGGGGKVVGAFVQVIPGGTHSVTIGSGGTGGAGTPGQVNVNAQNGGNGGSTIFDGVLTAPGGTGAIGAQSSRYNANPGSPGTVAADGSGTTSVTALSPGGALARVYTITSQTTGASSGGNAGAGVNNRYGQNAGAGGNGASGIVHIYI